MKVICSNSKLHEGMQLVGNVVTTSTTKPILQAVKLETVDNMLEISGTDLEVGMKCLVETEKVMKPGSIVLPGDRVMGLFREWVEGKVQLEVQGNSCRISGEGCDFKLLGYAPEEFPTIPSFIEKGYFEVDSGKMGEMVRKTAFACANERLRHTMTGVLMEVKGDVIKMVATDGRRMAYIKERVVNKDKTSHNSIIPAKGIQQLPKMAAQTSEPIKIRLEETHMVAKTEKVTLCSQLIEGQYPNYEEAIPKEDGEKLEVDTEILGSAVRRVAFLTTEERHVIRFRLRKDKVVISAETPDVGNAEVELGVDYKGTEMEVGLNPDFLLDGLKAIGKGPVRFMFKDPNAAATMRAGKEYLYVLMPIRLAEA